MESKLYTSSVPKEKQPWCYLVSRSGLVSFLVVILEAMFTVLLWKT